jgi:hypothetical protein
MGAPINQPWITSTSSLRPRLQQGEQKMRLSFVLKNKGRVVRKADDIAPLNRAMFAQRLGEGIKAAVRNIDCPADKQASFIEIEMDVSELTFSWKIKDACCKTFYDLMHPIILAAIVQQTHPTSSRT